MKFIMLVGLPGAGKSTYAKTNLIEDGVSYLSSDKIREELYGDESVQGDPNKVFRIMHQRVDELLNNGVTVVYDATNVTRKNRKSILQRIKQKHTGATLEAHIIWAPVETCIERDSNRGRTVGEQVIHKFLHRWETPYYDEGFDKIVLVTNVAESFDYREYHEYLWSKMSIPHDNPHHKLDILSHCLCAYELACKESDDVAVIESSRLHDIGKPMAKFFESNGSGVAHYYDHQNIGGYLVLGVFGEGKEDFAIEVSWLVTSHMEPFFNSKYYKSLSNKLLTRVNEIHKYDLMSH